MPIVTETTWQDRGVEKTYTSAHADDGCTRARNARVLARHETLDKALDEALWPCSGCVDLAALGVKNEPVAVDRAEVEHEARRAAQQAERERRENGAGPLRPPVPADVEVIPGRTNRYAGACAACGGHVAENAGLLAKRAGKFTVVHRTGADCREPEPAVEQSRPATTRTALPDVPEGHYAIKSTGSNDLAFYRVDRPTDGEYAGRVFVKSIVGGHPDRNVRRDAVAGILARIAEAGVEESARRYGQEIGRCCRCNRTLTDDESRAAGIGPECRRRA